MQCSRHAFLPSEKPGVHRPERRRVLPYLFLRALSSVRGTVEGADGYGTILLQVCYDNITRALQSRGRQTLTEGHTCRTMISNSSGTRSAPLPGSRPAG